MLLWRAHILNALAGLAVLCAILLPSRARAETEYEAKAKWLIGFAQFTNWRAEDFPSKDAPFTLAILGDNRFGKEIEWLKSKRVQNRPVEVKVFKSVEEVTTCQILFISASEQRTLPRILKSLKNRRILTISEVEGFFEEGGVACLTVKQTGVVVSKPIAQINPEATARGTWDFDPHFLAAIKTVKDQNK